MVCMCIMLDGKLVNVLSLIFSSLYANYYVVRLNHDRPWDIICITALTALW